MSSQTTFQALFPIRRINRENFPWVQKFEDFIDSISGHTFSTKDDTGSTISWKGAITAPTDELAKQLSEQENWGFIDLEKVAILTFTTPTLTTEQLRDLLNPNIDLSDDDIISIWAQFTIEFCAKEIDIIMLGADISMPDAAYRGSYLLKSTQYSKWENAGYAYIGDKYTYATELNLPETEFIDFKHIWKYLGRTPGLRSGVSTTPSSKLAVALTYLYKINSDSARFFSVTWICYGLEGFFSSGRTARGRQVSEKISLFLRLDDTICEKEIEKLYTHRSRFIHGNKALSGAGISLEPPEGKYSLEEWDVEGIGTYLLLESLRECVRRNIDEQKFHIVLSS